MATVLHTVAVKETRAVVWDGFSECAGTLTERTWECCECIRRVLDQEGRRTVLERTQIIAVDAFTSVSGSTV